MRFVDIMDNKNLGLIFEAIAGNNIFTLGTICS